MKTWPKKGIKMKEGPFAGKTVRMAAQDEVMKYDERLREMIYNCFGIKVALMTDMSTLSDFAPSEVDMAKLRRDYDAQANRHDTLVEIAKRVWG